MASKYLLNPIEIEAHVMGIWMEAKYRRVKFHVVLKEAMDNIRKELLDCCFNSSKIEFLIRRVYENWGFYALKRFPSLHGKRIRRPPVRKTVTC